MFLDLLLISAVLKGARARKEDLEKQIAEATQAVADRKQTSSQMEVKIQSVTVAQKQTEENVTSLQSQACKHASHVCTVEIEMQLNLINTQFLTFVFTACTKKF